MSTRNGAATRAAKVEAAQAPSEEVVSGAIITIKPIRRERVEVPIIGTAPLIVHRFDEKARATLLDQFQNKTRTKKDPKDPDADYKRSMYRFSDGGHGFPAVGFKAAVVDSARLFDNVRMTELKACLHVIGEGPESLVRIQGDPKMREDLVRLTQTKTDLRYRAEYSPWKAMLLVDYIPSMVSAESVFALVDAAGLGGIGEWRPSKAKTGIYGTFRVDWS